MRAALSLSAIGLILLSVPIVYLWINHYSLFPENEPTGPGLIRLLLCGLIFLLGAGVLLAAAFYFQTHRNSTAASRRQTDECA
jgi:hypothetical protein